MKPITYLKGDATAPAVGGGHKFIIHGCNDQGRWGAGFVMALSAKCDLPEIHYRIWYACRDNPATQPKFIGGNTIIAPFVGETTYVFNMISQHGTGEFGLPIRYVWLLSAMHKIRKTAVAYPDSSIHMPRVGCGLAGGRWDYVEELVKSAFCNHDVPVFVYDL